jgi:hypothetical protein
MIIVHIYKHKIYYRITFKFTYTDFHEILTVSLDTLVQLFSKYIIYH